MKVLIVEDEPILLRVLERAFVRSGHSVRGIASGVDALKDLKENLYDFVLMDVQLYGLNAPELLTQLAASGVTLDRNKLAIMSAYPKHVVDSLFSSGSESQKLEYVFLQKPFEDVLKLVAMVENGLKA